MELRTHNIFVDSEGKFTRDHKFGISQDPETNTKTTAIFRETLTHSDAIANILKVRDASKLVGAGTVFQNGKIEFCSDSCQIKWGFDRPENNEEADAIIEELRTLLIQKGYIS